MIDDIYFKVNEKMQTDENARQIIDNYLDFEISSVDIEKYKHALIYRDFDLAHLLFKNINNDDNCNYEVLKNISDSYPQIIEAWSRINQNTFKKNVIADIGEINSIDPYSVDMYDVLNYMIDIKSDLSHILCLTRLQSIGNEQKIKILDRYSFKDIVNEFNEKQIDLYQDVYYKPLIFYLNPLMIHGNEWNNIKNITYLNKTYQETIIDNIKANPLRYTNDMEKIYHIFNDLNKKDEVMDLFKSMIKDKNFLLSDLSSNDITSEYIGYNAMDKEKDNITSLSELNKKARNLIGVLNCP